MTEDMPKTAGEARRLDAGLFGKVAEAYLSEGSLKDEARGIVKMAGEGASGLAVSDALFEKLLRMSDERAFRLEADILCHRDPRVRNTWQEPGVSPWYAIHMLIETEMLEPTQSQICSFMKALGVLREWKRDVAEGRLPIEYNTPVQEETASGQAVHTFNVTLCALVHRLSLGEIKEIWAGMSRENRRRLVLSYIEKAAPSKEVLDFLDTELHLVMREAYHRNDRVEAHAFLQRLDEMRGRKPVKPPKAPEAFRPLKPPTPKRLG